MVCHSAIRCTRRTDGASVAAAPERIELRAFLHRFELRLAVITALALLVAQLGATSHAYAHDVVARTSAALHGVPGAHNPCNDCLAYAPLLSAAGAPAALPRIGRQAPGTARSAVAESLAARAPSLAFRSRAPPYAT
jgi:hypothetical protein